MLQRENGNDIQAGIQPDVATVSAARRAARDGQARHLLVVRGENGGSMTYGTLFTSDAALADEAAMLRRLGLDAPLHAVTARADGDISVRPLAA